MLSLSPPSIHFSSHPFNTQARGNMELRGKKCTTCLKTWSVDMLAKITFVMLCISLALLQPKQSSRLIVVTSWTLCCLSTTGEVSSSEQAVLKMNGGCPCCSILTDVRVLGSTVIFSCVLPRGQRARER